jgi:hypothetical protein
MRVPPPPSPPSPPSRGGHANANLFHADLFHSFHVVVILYSNLDWQNARGVAASGLPPTPLTLNWATARIWVICALCGNVPWVLELMLEEPKLPTMPKSERVLELLLEGPAAVVGARMLY